MPCIVIDTWTSHVEAQLYLDAKRKSIVYNGLNCWKAAADWVYLSIELPTGKSDLWAELMYATLAAMGNFSLVQ